MGHGDDLDLFEVLLLVGVLRKRARVGDVDLLEGGIVDPFEGRTGKHGVGREGAHAVGAPLEELVGGGGEGAGGVDDVVDDDDVTAFDLADGLNLLDDIGAGASLVADDDRAVEGLGVDVGALRSAHVRGGDGERVAVLALEFLQDVEEVHRRIKMIHREVEEALDLVCVEVAGHQAVRTDGAEHIGDDLGADGHARLVLSVLAGPSEIGDHGDDLVGGGALGGVDGQEQFHQVVGRRERRLDDEASGAADALGERGLELAVAELGDFEGAQGNLRIIGVLDLVHFIYDFLCEVQRGPAGENRHSVLVYVVQHDE